MKLKQRTGFFYGGVVFAFILIIASCNKMDSTYYDFIKNGERTYAGKADSLKASAGKDRVKLSWLLIADPSIKKCKIFWQENGVPDSMEIMVNRTSGVDSINAIVNNLDEGTYTFSVYTYDNNGNRSIESNIIGTVFGSVYQSSLFNRAVENISQVKNPVISWLGPGKNAVGTDLNFTNNDGELIHTFIASNNDHTTLPDYKSSSPIIFRTKFLPTRDAIDTFYTDWDTLSLDISEQEIDKSKFEEYTLPGDCNIHDDDYVSHLWNNDKYSRDAFVSWTGGPMGVTEMPNISFTFSMGVSATLSRFKLWQLDDDGTFVVYGGANPKKFEVWGTNEVPDADGSFSNWIKLGDFEMKKPSGLPEGSLSSEDIAAVKAGHDFKFPPGIPAVKYLRFRFQENWGGSGLLWFSELTFLGEVQ